ncbi:MAG TPA: flagellar basal body-associated protein FliL [Pseudolabrys sp.]|nr:flagellar basal body-associated protein FliL [Pseudolabrys sp.]
MNLRSSLCVLFVLALSTAGLAESVQSKRVSGLENAVILIIRHAEKPDTGHSLSPAGETRADACASYFANFVIDGRQLKLDHIFATRDTRHSHRPRLTVEPTAQKFGLPIDDRFKNKQFLKLVDEIKSWPHGEDVLISWHHGKIPQLLRALGADPQKLLPNGKWPDSSFDWLIQLRYDQNGRLMESKRVDACAISSR